MIQKLDLAARKMTPAVVTIMLVLLGAIPLQLADFGPVAPLYVLMAVYYWAVHRPDLMPFSVVFLVGLLHDAITGAPLGIHSFIFLVSAWLAYSQRRFFVGKPFIFLWNGFLVICALAMVVEWLAFSAFFATVMPMTPIAFRALLTGALFPPLAWVLIQVHRGFLRQPA
jgi:rod shape-determining protein MreD